MKRPPGLTVGRLHRSASPHPRIAASAETAVEWVPLWFEQFMLVICAAILAFGGSGLVLAMAGHYTGRSALILGSLGTALGGMAAWRHASPRIGRRTGNAPALVMIVCAAAFTVWNASFSPQHVVVDRDPGVYTVAGKWISLHGTLRVDGAAGWVPHSGLIFGSAGLYPDPAGHVQFQFPHLVPTLLAEAADLGGDRLMFQLPALLSALALCAVYGLGCRLVRRPWLVLGAVIGLGLSLPEVFVARDAYSESTTQLLLWSGIWLLLIGFSRDHWPSALLGGLALGGTLMARIDSVAFLMFLPLLAALGWLATPRPRRKAVRRIGGAGVLGVGTTSAVGTVDVQRFSAGYYHDLHGSVVNLYLVLAGCCVIAALLVILWPRLSLAEGFTRARQRFAAVTGTSVAVILLGAWALRPQFQTTRLNATPNQLATMRAIGSLQQFEGIPRDPTRVYSEQSLTWVSWYIGPVGLTLAIGGIGWLVASLLRRPSAEIAAVLGITGALTMIYLWNPSITPVQIWAMRRFVPASLPLLACSAAAAVAVLSTAASRLSGRTAGRLIATGGCIALVAFPLGSTWKLRDAQWQHGYLAVVKTTCRTIGAHAALLWAAQDTLGASLLQTARSWCDAPVAQLAHPLSAPELRSLSAQLHSRGLTLWIAGSSAASVTRSAPGASPRLTASAVSTKEIAQTLVVPPSRYQTARVNIYLSPIG